MEELHSVLQTAQRMLGNKRVDAAQAMEDMHYVLQTAQ
jgi:hypothetical protein